MNTIYYLIFYPSISNLSGLNLQSVFPPSLGHILLIKFSNQLESLHMEEEKGIFEFMIHDFGQDAVKYKFSNLKELCLGYFTKNIDFDIFSATCNKLQRLHIS